MRRLRTGDTVVVIRGEDKGKRGKVSRVIAGRDQVVVEGVNNVKRHVKATQQRAGGILEVEAPIAASKVSLVDPTSGKPTRIKFKTENGKKVRVAKAGGAISAE